jgi:hypothetical protein
MKAIDYLLLAEWLIEHRRSPDGFRTSVSRSYYAALHTSIELLTKMAVAIPNDRNKHEVVPDLLEHTDDTDIRYVGGMLSDLRGHRNKADYSLQEPKAETEECARLRLKEARDVVAKLNSCKLNKAKFDKAALGAAKRASVLFLGK